MQRCPDNWLTSASLAESALGALNTSTTMEGMVSANLAYALVRAYSTKPGCRHLITAGVAFCGFHDRGEFASGTPVTFSGVHVRHEVSRRADAARGHAALKSRTPNLTLHAKRRARHCREKAPVAAEAHAGTTGVCIGARFARKACLCWLIFCPVGAFFAGRTVGIG